MDHKLHGLQSYYVFMLMLLEFQWRPVFPAPTPSSCAVDLERTNSLTTLLKFETSDLLNKYKEFFYVNFSLSLPEDVPDSKISGMNISEKLRDISSKDLLFGFHIAKVEEYQAIWGSYQPVMELLKIVKSRLLQLPTSLKNAVSNLDINFSLPTQPALPQLSHKHDFLKKRYCLGVISSLRDWLTNVLEVLQDNKGLCAHKRRLVRLWLHKPAISLSHNPKAGVRMQHRAGLLKVGCVCAMILMHSPDAGAAGEACRLRELTAHTRGLLEDSLRGFDRANGDHLGTWPPGFPELRVKHNSPLSGPAVQCCLLFVAAGLHSLLEDQRTDLNPEDASLLQQLKDSGHTLSLLVVCAKNTLGGDCSPKPPAPAMPGPAFERKQWGHTLLRAAVDYLAYMERQVGLRARRARATAKTPGGRGGRHEGWLKAGG